MISRDFPDAFTTTRLRAERLTPDHLPELRRMHRDAAVMALLGGVRNEEQTAAYLDHNLRHWAEHGFGLWILHERGGAGGGAPIGRAVLRHVQVEDTDEVEVGYAFYQSHWGRGLATEIAARCVDLATTELGLTSIVGLTSPMNQASRHVLEKVGLAYERDFLHEGQPHALFRRRLG